MKRSGIGKNLNFKAREIELFLLIFIELRKNQKCGIIYMVIKFAISKFKKQKA